MNNRDGLTPVQVLLVEDDAGDALMTREAFEFHKVCNPLHVVTDGEQALQFVRREGAFADAPRPGLILLDVNLPRLNGLEVLAELKQDPDLRVIPVVMLTTSRAEEDILRSYKLHANAYVTKPVDFEHFVEAIKQIDDFFLALVQLPPLLTTESHNPLQWVLMAADAEQLRILLVEDDDGDALLIEELLNEAGLAVEVQRARQLADAGKLIPGAACVLLDLGLPDSQGLDGLRRLLQQEPDATIVVLTGLSDEYLGAEAVRAGAQDYLVKGEVTGKLLRRVIRYAMERRRWDEAQRQLQLARARAQENARLERGLLPSAVLYDARLNVSARYRVGGNQRLIGGDFYDVVQTPDGWVHVLIGDVRGHGSAEAALGVCLRVAWRALVLAGQLPEDVLSTVQLVLWHEEQDEAMFATICMVSVAPGRRDGILRLAGHPVPLLVTPDRITELTAPTSLPPGLNDPGEWPQRPVEFGDRWSLLLYTDGLIEGRIGPGADRLGTEGLIGLLRDALGAPPFDPARVCDEALLNKLIDQVRELNGSELNDDIAILALGYS